MDAVDGLALGKVRLKGRLLLRVEELARVGVEDEQVVRTQCLGAVRGGKEGRATHMDEKSSKSVRSETDMQKRDRDAHWLHSSRL